MSTPRNPAPVKLIASMIYQAETEDLPDFVRSILDQLCSRFGPFDHQTMPAPFTHTHYYRKEMGEALWRLFVSFAPLVERDCLPDVKLATNAIEQEYADRQGQRRVNIDPGLVTLENLVLATGKNFTHRIYLRDGIFAEITLLYQQKRFNTLPWTYPDYAEPQTIAVVTEIRNRLVSEYKAKGLL